MKVEESSMSDKKTGGFWDSYRRAMVYKIHFRLLVMHPFVALVMWLLSYIVGVNPLEHHPYIFYATIMVVILTSEGLTFLTRKYDLHNLNNKEIPEPFVRVLQYLLSGIMLMAICVYVISMATVRMYGPPILGVKPIIFWGICYTVFFIIMTSVTALIGERAIKKRKLNSPGV